MYSLSAASVRSFVVVHNKLVLVVYHSHSFVLVFYQLVAKIYYSSAFLLTTAWGCPFSHRGTQFYIDLGMGILISEGSPYLRDNGTIAFEIDSCTRGYHAYCTIWSPTLGEHISCKREIANAEDPYAVAVMLRNTFVMQLLWID